MLLKLAVLVVGAGSVVSVGIDADESVGDLKKLICTEQQYTFPASGLTLFEAVAVADGSAAPPSGRKWLPTDDPDAKRMKKGAAADPARFLLEDHEMDATYPLSEYFSGDNAPKGKEIHVLVVLPPGAGPLPVTIDALAPSKPPQVPVPVVQPVTPVISAPPVQNMAPPPPPPPMTAPQREQVPSPEPEPDFAAPVTPPPASAAREKKPLKEKKPKKDRPDKVLAPRKAAVAKPALPVVAILPKRPAPATNPDEKRKLQTSTWSLKASALFFYFHEGLGNRNLVLTCDAFEIVTGTFRNWLTKKEFYPKWVPFVEDMTVKDAMMFIPSELHAQFQIAELHPDAKVTIPEKYLKAGSKRSRAADLSQANAFQSALKKPRVTITPNSKSIGSGRVAKYPAQEVFLMEQVQMAWETGNPLTTSQIYVLLNKEFGRRRALDAGDDVTMDYVQSEFEARMSIDSGKTAAPLSQWVSRRLDNNNWNVKARKVAPKVPTDWYELAIKTSTELRAMMRDVDVLINADEMFMNFYPQDERQLGINQSSTDGEDSSPGPDPVSPSTTADTKKGCTVMLSCEFFSSMLLPPFIIMPSADGANDNDVDPLVKKYEARIANGGHSEICFQSTHWMNVRSAKMYLDFLVSMYPCKQIGLIWDTASNHINQEVLDYMSALDIAVGFIPPGLTSSMQVCDYVGAKKLIQDEVKEQFGNWKVAQSLIPVDGKFRIDRSKLITWIETAATKVSESNRDWQIKKMFQRLGQDPRSSSVEVDTEFLDHLRGLSSETLAGALLETQVALDLE
uniref:Crinkler effector protein N-terminal domain-containing protein n=1 Tax=Globisporangium ultimum (strain ATCC 200006 / CBS 805.95 / DAOM BR144) TaxID=431595 RepID=K3WBF4_GLOUD